MKYLIQCFCFEVLFVDDIKRNAWLPVLLVLYCFHLPFVDFDNFVSIVKKGFHAPNNGLWVKIAVKSFIESSLEVKKEKHEFVCVQIVVLGGYGHCYQSELVFARIFLQSATDAYVCYLRHQPDCRCQFPV